MSSLDLDPQAIVRTANALVDDHLRAGRTFCFTLSTSSMWPALMPGDRGHVRAARADDLRPGDILVRRAEASWIAHRLIRRPVYADETRLVTKGDNALTADAAWPAAHLAGVVVAVERDWPKPAARLAQAKWQARLIALLSRGQLMASRIQPLICRRMAIKITHAGLRAAGRLAQ